jgi:hypothetical protein
MCPRTKIKKGTYSKKYLISLTNLPKLHPSFGQESEAVSRYGVQSQKHPAARDRVRKGS